MNSVCLIDERLFYRYLELKVKLKLPPNARRQLSPAIAYWNETEDLQDLRSLARGLSELLEIGKRGLPKNTKPVSLKKDRLNELFQAPTEEDLKPVLLTDER